MLLNIVERVDKVDRVDRVDRVDKVDKVDKVHQVDKPYFILPALQITNYKSQIINQKSWLPAYCFCIQYFNCFFIIGKGFLRRFADTYNSNFAELRQSANHMKHYAFLC